MPKLPQNILGPGEEGEEDEDTDLREDLELEPPEEEDEESEVEKQARAMGWHPKDEFMGPAYKWVPAAEFVRRGENVLPILRENYKKLQADFGRQAENMRGLETKLSEQTQLIQEIRDMAKSANERGYQRAKSEIEAAKRKAVQEGDVEGYDRLDAQLQDAERVRAETKRDAQPPPPPPQTPAEAPEVTAFKRDNPWFMNDQILNLAMQEAHIRLKTEEPGLSLEDNLEKAKEIVIARYPQKFGRTGQPRPRAASVSAPSPANRQPARQPKSPLDQIEDVQDRAEAKAAYAKMKRQMPDFTEEEYMLYWNDPKADVLTMRRSKRENIRGRQ